MTELTELTELANRAREQLSVTRLGNSTVWQTDKDLAVIADLLAAVERLTPRVIETVSDLVALPTDSVVRAERVQTMPSGRKHVISSYFERRSSRDEWVEMDPADRMDGEDSLTSEEVCWRHARAGRVIVLYVPEGGGPQRHDDPPEAAAPCANTGHGPCEFHDLARRDGGDE